jgi:hypothetical protein
VAYPFGESIAQVAVQGFVYGVADVINPIETKRIEMADKRKGMISRHFSFSRSGRISWANWFATRKENK